MDIGKITLTTDSPSVKRLEQTAQELHKRVAALESKIPAPPSDWKLPVRWDGEHLLDATDRILVWGSEVGERTARYLVALINGAGELHEKT